MSRARIAELRRAWSAYTDATPLSLEAFVGRAPRGPLRRAMARVRNRYPSARTGLNRWEEFLLHALDPYGSSAASAVGRALTKFDGESDRPGELWLFWRLKRLGAPTLPHPLVAFEGRSERFPPRRATLTAAGGAVLRGEMNHIVINGADEWIGGAHLSHPDGQAWFRDGERLVPRPERINAKERRERSRVASVPLETCPSCGLQLPRREGEDLFGEVASGSCFAMYSGLSAKGRDEREILSNTYLAQHPSLRTSLRKTKASRQSRRALLRARDRFARGGDRARAGQCVSREAGRCAHHASALARRSDRRVGLRGARSADSKGSSDGLGELCVARVVGPSCSDRRPRAPSSGECEDAVTASAKTR